MNWRDIPGLEGAYQVSDTGLVRGMDRYVNNRGGQAFRRGQILKPTVTHNGYLVVQIGGHRRTVHGLVLEAFVGPRPEGADTLHANDVRDDNRLENLSWGTRSQNMLDAVTRGRHPQARKTQCPNGHDYTPENATFGTRSRGTNYRRCRICQRASRPPITREQLARKSELQRIRRAKRRATA